MQWKSTGGLGLFDEFRRRLASFLKAAVEFRSEPQTVPDQIGLQTLKESPFWSDAERGKVLLPGTPLGAFRKVQMITVYEVCV